MGMWGTKIFEMANTIYLFIFHLNLDFKRNETLKLDKVPYQSLFRQDYHCLLGPTGFIISYIFCDKSKSRYQGNTSIM